MPLPRHTPLAGTGSLRAARRCASRTRPTGPTPTTRELVWARARGRCEVCGDPIAGWPGFSIHHRHPRRMGSRRPELNTAANALAVCGSGTTGCLDRIEKNRDRAHEGGLLLHDGQTSTGFPVMLASPTTRTGGPASCASPTTAPTTRSPHVIHCLHCLTETSNGPAVCEICQRYDVAALEHLPICFLNLSRWRPGRPAGSCSVHGSRVLYDGHDRIQGTADGISDDLDETTDTLASSAGGFVRELAYHEQLLHGLTEQLVPGWYAGAAVAAGSPPTWCTRVTCGGCGATTYTRDQLNTILAEAGHWRACPRLLAEAIVALVDTEFSVPRLYERIRQWAHRGDLTSSRRTSCDYTWTTTPRAW